MQQLKGDISQPKPTSQQWCIVNSCENLLKGNTGQMCGGQRLGVLTRDNAMNQEVADQCEHHVSTDSETESRAAK